MRANLADLKPEEVRVFREQARKGYAGHCVFCGQDRGKLKDHVWRKHQPEMQELYRRINENEQLKAHTDGRPHDKASELLRKRKAQQEEPVRQQSVHPDPYTPDGAVDAEQPWRQAFSQGVEYNWRALLSPSLQGTIGTVPEPSYNINSWPLETDADKREVLGASMLLKVAEEKRQEYVVAHMEAVQAQRVAEDVKDRAAAKAIQARKAE